MQDWPDQGKGIRYNRNKILTMIGALLIQFSAGLIPVWGNANLYFLSYFKNHNEHVDKNTNSWILLSTVVPMAIFIVFSAKLSNRFGYTNFIKICAVIYFLSYLVIYIKFNMTICVIFLLIIPITVNSMSFIPMYNCLWSYFMNKKSTVTGYALVSYGVSGALFNILFLHLVNPDNYQATLNDNGFVYFDENVTNNLLGSVKIIYFIVAMCFMVGAWMVRNQKQQEQNQKQQQQGNLQQNQGHYQLKQQVQQAPNTNQLKLPSEIGQIPSNNNKQIQLIEYKNASPSPMISTQSMNNQNVQQHFRLKKYLFDWKFILIFCNVLFIDLYVTYLLTNFKLIFIDDINDDHFLGYCLVANTITALIGTFIWGCLGDKLLVEKTMLAIVIVDSIIKLFGIFSTTKPTLMILMFFLGFTSRGMSTVAGPGLIEVFGLKIATQLLPMKALAVIGSMVLVPILQLIFLNFLTPFKFMTLLMFVNVLLLALTYYFNKHFQPIQQNFQHKQKQQN